MATERRLIDANDLKWKIGQVCLYVASLRCGKTIISKLLESYRKAVFEEIENAPTVDAVEVVHGEWSTIEDDYCGLTALQCSKCNQEYWFEEEPPMKIYNYCPNCGAKMDGDGNG